MSEPRPISIWQPREVDGRLAFVRPERLPLGDHHAAERVLTPRPAAGTRRLVLLGESAAAGYLYAPHVTPARVLAAQLAAVAGPGAYEVIDLARTNERLDSLAATAESALQLAPDLFVVFAGNNWSLLETPEVSPYFPSPGARRDYAEAWAEEGLAGPVALARRRLAARAGAALERLAAAAAAGGAPVVLVLPEVNLADWESRQPVVWLPGDGVARWYAALARARAALAAGEATEAEAAAWEMIRLDGSSGPLPYRLLAAAWRAAGREEEARDACLAEVDCVHYPLLAFLAAPQATTPARQVLAAAARRHGFASVDLRPLLAADGPSPLPGRRLFLDYCHLTLAGMKLAMAAVAAAALRLLAPDGPCPDGRELAARLPDPEVSPEVDATAKLGAAIHTAHRLLPVTGPTPLVEHWCRAALDASPGVAAAMLDLAAARAAPCPAVLTAAQQRSYASPYRLELQHGWRWDGLDADLLAAMGAALRRAGRPEAAEIEPLILAGCRLPAGGADLVHPPRLLAEPLTRFFPEVMGSPAGGGRATHRSPWPESAFCLVTDGERDVGLEIEARLPPAPAATARRGGVSVSVDGRPLGVFAASERWGRTSLRLPAGALARGISRLTLAWPMPPPAGDDPLAGARRRLAEGLEADLHPVFGELFSLRARPL